MIGRWAVLSLVGVFAAGGCGTEIDEAARARRAKELKPYEGGYVHLLTHAEGDTSKDRYHVVEECEVYSSDVVRSYGIGNKRFFKRRQLRVKDGELVDGKGTPYRLPAAACAVCVEE